MEDDLDDIISSLGSIADVREQAAELDRRIGLCDEVLYKLKLGHKPEQLGLFGAGMSYVLTESDLRPLFPEQPVRLILDAKLPRQKELVKRRLSRLKTVRELLRNRSE